VIWLEIAIHRLLLRHADCEAAGPVRLCAFKLDPALRAAAFGKVRAALELIARHAPELGEQLGAGVRTLFLLELEDHAGRYVPQLDLCELDEDYVLAPSTSATEVARTIVREAARAALRRDPGRSPPSAHEEERACLAAERLLERWLPEADAPLAGAGRRLRHPPEYDSPVVAVERRLAGVREVRVPTWLLRPLAWWGRRAAERRARRSAG